MKNDNELLLNPAGIRVVINRVFDAPVDMVFSMWTNPEYVAKWWGPKNNTNSACAMDVRPGGSISITMHPADGSMIHVKGTFDEVRAPDRLVFTTVKDDETGNERLEVLHTVTFTEENGKTRLIMQVKIISTGPAFNTSCQQMEQGWNQSFDRLAEQIINETI